MVEGLTFDLLGLAPGRGLLAPEPRHCFGLTTDALAGCEAIGLAPGPHLAGAASAMPVVRTLLRLASALTSQWEAVVGILWQPGGSAVRRDVFLNAVEGWPADGPHPSLGLAGILIPGEGEFAGDVSLS